MNKKYYTADYLTLTKIEEFDTEEQALFAIESYEQRDRANGCYIPKNYAVVKANVLTNLKRIRTGTGLSQSELAERSGVNVRMIQHYEQGVKDINKAQAITVYKLTEALGCSMEELLEL